MTAKAATTTQRETTEYNGFIDDAPACSQSGAIIAQRRTTGKRGHAVKP
jgi:hypothetical protein